MVSEEVELRRREEGEDGTWTLGSKPEVLHIESKSEPSGTGGTGYAYVEDRMNLQF